MNILSHYYFDHLEGRHFYNFGLILPDMMATFKRGWKYKSEPDIQLKKNIDDLRKGILRHYQRDAAFHNSDFFLTTTRSLRKNFESKDFYYPKPRLDFISHILLELSIDKYLIKVNDGLLDRFYVEIGLVEKKDLDELFLHDPGYDPVRFFDHIRLFNERKFLKRYVDKQGVYFVINRILTRVKLPQIREEEVAKFEQVLFETEKLIEEKIDLIHAILPDN